MISLHIKQYQNRQIQSFEDHEMTVDEFKIFILKLCSFGGGDAINGLT